MSHDIKMAVIACNTASAVALEPLSKALAPLPVIGVIEPGARAAVAATHNNHIAVIATESTVKGGAYSRAIHKLAPDAHVTQEPCALFVALAEEGWISGDVAEAAARRYLTPLFNRPARPDTLVLGCTHFPALSASIAAVAGEGVTLVDSAATTAESVEAALKEKSLSSASKTKGKTRFLATDNPERFARVGGIFFGEHIGPEDVELIDIRPS